jgi:hypothetical protein
VATEPQTLANHARIDPWYHFVAFGLLGLAFILSILHLIHQGRPALWQVIVSFALLVLWARIRSYALRVQDRLIRLEETLRMKALLPEALQARVAGLTPAQFVALRFASDAELQARVEEALTEQLSGKAIKHRIQVWRPDTFRV